MRAVIVAGVLAIAGATALKNTSIAFHGAADVESRLVYLPSADTMERWSFGYKEALADLVFIRGNIVTSALQRRSEHQWIPRYFDVLHRLDPRFHTIYRWAAVASIYSGLRVIERSYVETSQRIYDVALEEYPNDHELLWYGGMVEFNDVSAQTGFSPEEIERARAKGTARIRRAAEAGASPLVRRLALSLTKNSENVDAELERAYLRSQLLTTTDEDLLNYAMTRLLELSTAVETERLSTLKSSFFRRLEDEFPYVPPPIYIMLESQ